MPRKKSATNRKRPSKATRSIPSEHTAEQSPHATAVAGNAQTAIAEDNVDSAIVKDNVHTGTLEEQESAVIPSETAIDQDNEPDDEEIETSEIDEIKTPEIDEIKTPEIDEIETSEIDEIETSEVVTSDVSTSETVKTVDAVVDRRSPETDNPQPIHPMDAMTAQLEEPEVLTNATGEEPITLEVQVEAVPAPVEAVPTPSIQVQTTPAKTVLSGPVVDKLNVAIATAHRHEEELESHIMAIQAHEDQLNQQVIDAQNKSNTLAKTLEAAETRESNLKQEIADLKHELDQTKTQAIQLQAQINDQDKNQRERVKLQAEVAALKTELDDAKRYILQLTESQSTAPSSSRRVPHTRVVGSPRRLSRPITPIKSSNTTQPTGLPPMSTDPFSTDPFSHTTSQDSAATHLPERPATQRSPQTLRPAYTRPGFANPRSNAASASPNLPIRPSQSAPQPMPPLQSRSRSHDASSLPPSSSPASAIAPQQSALARRRSRYDELKPELKSSDLPQPKVSDAEIGWFD